ncbi:MAG: hypothetical protein DHS20C02_07320 [Micavibrio sp.]|nr:MAG: hypothetical protein DHS20C02_07320 [Micavibrio sp.]
MATSLEDLRVEFRTAGHEEYLKQDRMPNPDFKQTKKSILFSIRYREALLEQHKGTETSSQYFMNEHKTKPLEAPNLYEALAKADIRRTLLQVAALGNEESFWEDKDHTHQALPARSDIIAAIELSDLQRYREYMSEAQKSDNLTMQRALYDLYNRRLEVDTALQMHPKPNVVEL